MQQAIDATPPATVVDTIEGDVSKIQCSPIKQLLKLDWCLQEPLEHMG